jgi:hypothetical protein
MKTKNLFLTFALIGAIALNVDAQTQPPNAGFENWVSIGPAENPVGWSSFNNFYSYGVPEMSFKTTDANSGTYALRLISETATLPPPLGTNTLDTLAGYVFLGDDDMNNTGIPYTGRPILMQAFVKGTIIAGNEAYLMATLSKWNTTTLARDQVGFAMYYTSSSISNYTQISAPFNYSLAVIPDTLDIKFMAGNVGPGGFIMPGNEFFIDDISFTFPEGINEPSKDNHSINIFPNPATDNITIVTPQKSEIEISNIQGRIIKNITSKGNKTSVDILEFPNGIYVVKVKNEKGAVVEKFIKE